MLLFATLAGSALCCFTDAKRTLCSSNRRHFVAPLDRGQLVVSMGGIAAKHDGVHFRHRDEYTRWTLSDVKSAVKRWHAVSKKAAASATPQRVVAHSLKFGVSRREFWEVFTDYTVLRSGAFLCLPVRCLLCAPVLWWQGCGAVGSRASSSQGGVSTDGAFCCI